MFILDFFGTDSGPNRYKDEANNSRGTECVHLFKCKDHGRVSRKGIDAFEKNKQ